MRAFALVAASMLLLSAPSPAATTADFLASLSESEIDEFRAWKEARRDFERQLEAYWDAVENKRIERKKKRTAKLQFDSTDYVMSFPPAYQGPKLSSELEKKYAEFLESQKAANPAPPAKE